MQKELDWGTGNGLLETIVIILQALVELIMTIAQLFAGGEE